MKRSELEALDSSALERLIVDATSVLAARAKGAGSQIFAPADRVPVGQSSGSLFTFGAPAASGSAGSSSSGGLFSGASSGGLFSGGLFSNAGTGSLFGTGGSAGTGGGSAGTGGLFGGAADGKLFGGTGGGLFSGTSITPSTPATAEAGADEEGDENEDQLVNEEEVTAVYGWTPSITLEVRDDIINGEEGEEQIYSERTKLLRFRDGEWKERGLGDARLMKDKKSGRIRFLMRQEKTGKVVANHYVVGNETYCDLRPNANSEKVWVWTAQDVSDGDLQVETYALKFKNAEQAGQFKEAFDAAKVSNAEVASSG